MNIRTIPSSGCGRWLAALLILAAAASAQAAPITWGVPVDITADADVSTNGTLVAAFNFNGPATTVNGVTFQPFAAAGSGSFTVGDYTLANGFFVGNANTGSASPPFANVSASYQALLGSAASAISNSTLTLGGLTVGQKYEFQAWANNSNGEFGYGLGLSDDPFGNSVFLDARVGGDPGFLGQHVIGTFTADASTQLIILSPSEVSYINGFQLRAVAPEEVAVPEPASLALFGIGAAVICGWRRRRGVRQ